MVLDVVERTWPRRVGAAGEGPPGVVCVDDDPSYLRSLSRWLAERGYRAHVFGEATQALAALDELQPALALVDVMMPGMDGLDLAQEIRSRSHRRIPVVLLSGLSRAEVAGESRESGASLYLEKAGDPGDLARAVELFAGPGKESP
jgi:CheY-like chemotaxis protein